MRLIIIDVDYAPAELHDKVPIMLELIREIPGDDRPDYWIAVVESPITWLEDNHQRIIDHVIIATRWQGTRIEKGMDHLPIGIAYVTDESVIGDEHLDFNKIRYIAIGMASDASLGSATIKPTNLSSGRIGKVFGLGNSD